MATALEVSFTSLLSTAAVGCSPGVDAVPEHIEHVQTRTSSRCELKSHRSFLVAAAADA